MTREDIIRMAREATDEYAKENAWRKNFWRFSQEELQRFAALVAAHREAQSIHTCGPDCQKPMCVSRRREIAAAVEAEREAILAVIEAYKVPVGNSAAGEMACEWTMDALRDLRDAIRARGSK
jgi:hypothetical protein